MFEGVDSAFYCWLNGQVRRACICLAISGTCPASHTSHLCPGTSSPWCMSRKVF